MSKYFFFGNASRRLKSGKFTFTFDVVDQFAGSWRGILKLEDPDAIAAISSETAKQIGVKEITEEEYEAWKKKSLNSKSPSPDITRLPISSTIEARAGHVVVKDNLNRTILEKTGEPVVNVKPTIADAVTLGEAPFIDPLEKRVGKKRVKRTD